MPAKDPRSEIQMPASGVDASLKRVERFLRLLTWQMFFLLAILLYLALRPQAGRYQFTVMGEDVGVFDTSNSRAWMIKLQKQVTTPGEEAESETQPAGGEEKK